MGIVYDNRKKVKTKKKPGWEQQAREEKEWLEKIRAQTTSFSSNKSKKVLVPIKSPVVSGVYIRPTVRLPSSTSFGSATKPLGTPEALYQEGEMLEREKKAREKKHATGPIYNKGNDVLLTEEMLKDIKSGITRRRN